MISHSAPKVPICSEIGEKCHRKSENQIRKELKTLKYNNIVMTTLLFGRLIFDEKESYKDKLEKISKRKERLLKVINFRKKINKLLDADKSLKHVSKEAEWCFAGIKESALQGYIYGKLIKEKTCEKLMRDESKEDYIFDKTKEPRFSFFLIDLNNSIIAYESKKKVGEKSPIAVIEGAFNQNFKEEGVRLDIESIKDKREIIKRIKSLRKINTVELSLFPTNPNSTNTSKKMDDFLREEKIKKINIKAYFKEEGYDIEKSQLLRSGFHLAQEGYGYAKAKGESSEEDEDKKYKTSPQAVSVGDTPIKSEVSLDLKNDSNNINSILNEIKSVIKRLEEVIV